LTDLETEGAGLGTARSSTVPREWEEAGTTPQPTRIVRGSRIAAAILFCGLSVWTILIAGTTFLRFDTVSSAGRLPLETVAFVISGLVSAMAYLSFSLTGIRSSMYIGLAFLPIAVTSLVFGLILRPGSLGPRESEAFYFWTAGRLVGAALIVQAARSTLRPRRRERHPLLRFTRGGLAVLGALAVIDVLLWLTRDQLPSLYSGTRVGAAARGAVHGLTAIDVTLGVAGVAVYLFAALVFLRRARGSQGGWPWLGPAFVVAAFCHLHYMLFPTVFTHVLSTGDLLRVGFAAVLLFGLMREVRATGLSERERARELALSYEAERLRVYELEELDRAREDLFRILTHEVMHPVAAIRSLAVTLSRRWNSLEETGRRELIDRIERETGRLRDMAERAAASGPIADDRISLSPRRQRVRDIVGEVVDAVPNVGDRLTVRVDPAVADAYVHVDPVRLLQVFRNLLSNAAKYSPDHTPIRLEVRGRAHEIEFAVEDQGPGIPREYFSRLFRRFSRIPGSSNGPDTGSGLGLYISRRIVEAHGGQMSVNSEPGKGSSFSFRLTRPKEAR
jgi:signal transduction histidine kinase